MRWNTQMILRSSARMIKNISIASPTQFWKPRCLKWSKTNQKEILFLTGKINSILNLKTYKFIKLALRNCTIYIRKKLKIWKNLKQLANFTNFCSHWAKENCKNVIKSRVIIFQTRMKSSLNQRKKSPQ